mmetsp:Transcript_2696/g.7039  ORF Transcript_2696/g.7039 Transcript_2696/m.7039 type:complete len:266 (+) Transcript_2696:224-1021(+)
MCMLYSAAPSPSARRAKCRLRHGNARESSPSSTCSVQVSMTRPPFAFTPLLTWSCSASWHTSRSLYLSLSCIVAPLSGDQKRESASGVLIRRTIKSLPPFSVAPFALAMVAMKPKRASNTAPFTSKHPLVARPAFHWNRLATTTSPTLSSSCLWGVTSSVWICASLQQTAPKAGRLRPTRISNPRNCALCLSSTTPRNLSPNANSSRRVAVRTSLVGLPSSPSPPVRTWRRVSIPNLDLTPTHVLGASKTAVGILARTWCACSVV